MSVDSSQRYTAKRPCPVCGGYESQERGKGERCTGFLSVDGKYAQCSRPEHEGSLTIKPSSDTHTHYLGGPCRCGTTHAIAVAQNQAKTIEAVYDYKDEGGSLTYQVVRYKPKRFAQRRPDGNGGWIWNLDGVTRTLYRLSEIIAADPDNWVFITEGERDADNAWNIGLPATCNSGGAGKWEDSFAALLINRRVAVIPDNDPTGHKHATRVADSLVGIASIVVLLTLDGLPEKGDLTDWFDLGHTAQELLGIADSAEPFKPAIDELDKQEEEGDEPIDIDSPGSTPPEAERIIPFYSAADDLDWLQRETEWVVDGMFAYGSTVELVGKIKLSGKTTFATRLSKAIINGVPFLERETKKSPVVYLTESAPTAFRAAMDRADLLGERDFIFMLWSDTDGLPWEKIAPQAVQKAVELGAVLIVDTLPQYAGIHGDGENSSGEGLRAMRPLQMGASLGLAILIIRHAKKAGGALGDSGRGSSAFGGAVDTLMELKRQEGQSSNSNIRILETVSRFDGMPSELYISHTDTGYEVLGEAKDVLAERVKEEVLSLVPVGEVEAVTTDAIKGETKYGKTTVADTLKELVQGGEILSIGQGRKGDPKRYYRVEIHSTAPKEGSTGGKDALIELVSVTTPSLRGEERIQGAL